MPWSNDNTAWYLVYLGNYVILGETREVELGINRLQDPENQASFTLPEWSMLQSVAYLPASNRPPLVKEVAVGGREGPCVCQQDFAPSYALNTLKLLKEDKNCSDETI